MKGYRPKFQSDMSIEYNKCQKIEQGRLDIMKEALCKASMIIDVNLVPEQAQVYIYKGKYPSWLGIMLFL